MSDEYTLDLEWKNFSLIRYVSIDADYPAPAPCSIISVGRLIVYEVSFVGVATKTKSRKIQRSEKANNGQKLSIPFNYDARSSQIRL